jgi:hypothetical protein
MEARTADEPGALELLAAVYHPFILAAPQKHWIHGTMVVSMHKLLAQIASPAQKLCAGNFIDWRLVSARAPAQLQRSIKPAPRFRSIIVHS